MATLSFFAAILERHKKFIAVILQVWLATVRSSCLYDSVDGVNDSVAGNDVKGSDVGFSGFAFDLK